VVLHCYVEKQMPGGLVYMMFSEISGAQNCALKMSGRWFNKRQVMTEYQPPAFYFRKFPEVICHPLYMIPGIETKERKGGVDG
jgi:hypothetical protein